MRSGIIALFIIAFLGYCSWRATNPSAEYLVDLVAVATVQEALKSTNVSFGPLVHKRAPDGAYIVAGTAKARGRDLAFQLRIERKCEAPETACYKPKLVYLGKWL